MKNLNSLNLVIIVVAIAIIGYLFHSKNVTKKEAINLADALADTVQYYKVQNNLNAAKIEILQTEKVSDFIELQSKEATIVKLQEIVKNYDKRNRDLTAAILHSDQTIIRYKDSLTAYVEDYENIVFDEGDTCIAPIYKRAFKLNNWVSGDVTLGINTFELNQIILNEYGITLGNEKVGLFKSKPYADITNYNPMSQPVSIRAYQKDAKPKLSPFSSTLLKVGIGVGLGIAIVKL